MIRGPRNSQPRNSQELAHHSWIHVDAVCAYFLFRGLFLFFLFSPFFFHYIQARSCCLETIKCSDPCSYQSPLPSWLPPAPSHPRRSRRCALPRSEVCLLHTLCRPVCKTGALPAHARAAKAYYAKRKWQERVVRPAVLYLPVDNVLGHNLVGACDFHRPCSVLLISRVFVQTCNRPLPCSICNVYVVLALMYGSVSLSSTHFGTRGRQAASPLFHLILPS